MSGKRKTPEEREREWNRLWKRGERAAKRVFPAGTSHIPLWDFTHGYTTGYIAARRASQRSARAAGKKGRGK